MAEAAHHVFTPEQVAWLERRFGPLRRDQDPDGTATADHGSVPERMARLEGHFSSIRHELGLIKWIIGGLAAFGATAIGFLYWEVADVRDQVHANSVALARNSVALAGNSDALARIEAILDERLPRDE